MKAEDLNRGLTQYGELNKINDKDEFLHCFVYELFIRDIKDYLIDEFKNFYIKEGKIELNEDGYLKVKRLIRESNEYDGIKAEISKREDLTPMQKLFYLLIRKIDDDLSFSYGIGLNNLYINYSFFDDDFKKIFNAIFEKKEIITKDIYNGLMKTETYFSNTYIRSHTFYPQMKDDPFRDIKTKYILNYKRPRFNNTIFSNNKKADIEINLDLPKDIIMKHVEKLINIMLEDKENIYSNKDKINSADGIQYEKNVNLIYKNKRMLVDGLLIFDYIQLREKEVKEEYEQNKKKKVKEISYIKKSYELTKIEKKERISNISNKYARKTKKDIKTELIKKTNYPYNTIETYQSSIVTLIKNKNYSKLLEGKELKPLNL